VLDKAVSELIMSQAVGIMLDERSSSEDFEKDVCFGFRGAPAFPSWELDLLMIVAWYCTTLRSDSERLLRFMSSLSDGVSDLIR
jgi:hypothetical protein